MKCAADFRASARNALTGRWTPAVLGGLIASVLGGATNNGVHYNGNIDFSFDWENVNKDWLSAMPNGFLQAVSVFFFVIAAFALVFAVAYFIVGSVVQVGYAQFNLDLIDRKELRYNTLVSRFRQWKKLALTALLQTMYVFLWMLLFIVPGIVASYSYAMTSYILAEHPELSPKEAIARSKAMMEGNRWRLCCLELSFIGWVLLCILTLGIGNLWLTPYIQAAKADFYREISYVEPVEPAEPVAILPEVPVEEQ